MRRDAGEQKSLHTGGEGHRFQERRRHGFGLRAADVARIFLAAFSVKRRRGPVMSRPTTIVPKPVFSSGAEAELDRASAAEFRKGGQHDYTE